jgi:hypothetical protein
MEQIKKMQKRIDRSRTNLSLQRETTRGSSGAFQERTLVLDWGDTETSLQLPEEDEDEDDDTEPTVNIRGTGKKVEKAPKDPSAYLQKLQSVFEIPATPTVSEKHVVTGVEKSKLKPRHV